MIYTVTQSKDPDMYEFWNERTVAGKKIPMLCMVVHCDCLDHTIVNTVNEAGVAEVYLEFSDE